MAYVEGIRSGVKPGKGGLFQVILDDSRVFDPEKFDEFANIVSEGSKFPYSLGIKYIVRGNRMIAFDGSLNHGVVDYNLAHNLSLRKGESVGDLYSAGFVRANFRVNEIVREIFGHSMTLERVLSQNDSSEFRRRVMQPVLGEYFTFLD